MLWSWEALRDTLLRVAGAPALGTSSGPALWCPFLPAGPAVSTDGRPSPGHRWGPAAQGVAWGDSLNIMCSLYLHNMGRPVRGSGQLGGGHCRGDVPSPPGSQSVLLWTCLFAFGDGEFWGGLLYG